jgi:Yqey-like protein
MSALKDQLKSDLTTAIKARDEVTSATIRMALTAITNEEVAGKESRTLSDDDVLTVSLPRRTTPPLDRSSPTASGPSWTSSRATCPSP